MRSTHITTAFLSSFRVINGAELEKLCDEKEMMTIKLTGLESDLKIQQQVLASDTCCNNISLLCISEPVFLACGLQKNSSLEKQLEDSDHNSKKVRKRKA